MGLFEIILIGLGLSMDAVAVSVSNGLAFPNMKGDMKLAMPIAFGLFQGFMPVLGFFAGGLFSDFISAYAGIITLIILGFIGGKMTFDALKGGDDEAEAPVFTYKLLIGQSIATSIDAFAVGVSFMATGANIFEAAPIIAITTFACSLAAVVLGKKLGAALGKKAQIFGGIVLILIGIKAIF